MVINLVIDSFQEDSENIMAGKYFGMDLEANACMSSISKVGMTKSKLSHMINHIKLSEKWCISPQKAKVTVHRTTHRGICTVLHPYLSRVFRKNDHKLHYRRLPNPVFLIHRYLELFRREKTSVLICLVHTLVGPESSRCKKIVMLMKDCLYYSNVMVCHQILSCMVQKSMSNHNFGEI